MEAPGFQRRTSNGEGEEEDLETSLSFYEADQGPVDIERGPQDPERSIHPNASTTILRNPYAHSSSNGGPTPLRSRSSQTTGASVSAPHPAPSGRGAGILEGAPPQGLQGPPFGGPHEGAPGGGPQTGAPGDPAGGALEGGPQQGAPQDGGGVCGVLSSSSVSSLFSPMELQKYASYDEALFEALRRSHCCCRWGPIAAFAAKHAAEQCVLTPKGVERYI